MLQKYSLKVVTAPTIEPVSLAEAKLQCRIDDDLTFDDALITSLIAAAREYCENETNRAFINTTYDLKMDAFSSGGEIVLPRAPASSVTSITYLDGDGASQTWSSTEYSVDINTEPGRVTLAYGYSWPTTRAIENAVAVRYVAGYGAAASSVPDSIKAAMKLIIEHLYRNRSATVIGSISSTLPLSVESLLNRYRLLEVA